MLCMQGLKFVVRELVCLILGEHWPKSRCHGLGQGHGRLGPTVNNLFIQLTVCWKDQLQ